MPVERRGGDDEADGRRGGAELAREERKQGRAADRVAAVGEERGGAQTRDRGALGRSTASTVREAEATTGVIAAP